MQNSGRFGYTSPMPAQQWIHRGLMLLAPYQAGALWIGLLITFILAGNHRRLVSWRNLACLLLLAPAAFLVDAIEWEHRLMRGEGSAETIVTWVFRCLFGFTFLAVLWGLFGSFLAPRRAWRPNVPRKALVVVGLLAVVLNACVVFGRFPDDAGIYSNLGAQRWLETGTLPYGDPGLKGPDSPGHGAAATYSPVLFLAHMPFQFLLGRSHNAADADPMSVSYRWPPLLATQLACFTFQLLALVALFVIGRQLRDASLGWLLVILYALSPFVLGLGQDAVGYVDGVRVREPGIGGLVYISHIAPPALLLMTFALLRKPVLAGAGLGLASACAYFPALMAPAFLGWYLWRRAGAWKFLVGFAVVGLLTVGVIWKMTDDPQGRGAAKLFLESTLEHQEGARADQYGGSPLSFWAHHPQLAKTWKAPLRGDSQLTSPAFLILAGLSLLGLLMAGPWVTPARFALLLVVVPAAFQLWKTHAAGSYVEWFYPFLLIGLFGRRDREEAKEAAPDAPLPEAGSLDS